ncbi:MAG: hypothetical protein MMC23_007227 [Stictis urceolatum]|nr:hypothetical protein [Stictis urceolata]
MPSSSASLSAFDVASNLVSKKSSTDRGPQSVWTYGVDSYVTQISSGSHLLAVQLIPGEGDTVLIRLPDCDLGVLVSYNSLLIAASPSVREQLERVVIVWLVDWVSSKQYRPSQSGG